MLPGDRRHLCPGHQALRGDLRLLRRRTIATPSWPLNHLKPTDAARLRDVQLDVHFAVYTHTDTSLTRGDIRTLPSLSARGDQLSAYHPVASTSTDGPITSSSVNPRRPNQPAAATVSTSFRWPHRASKTLWRTCSGSGSINGARMNSH